MWGKYRSRYLKKISADDRQTKCCSAILKNGEYRDFIAAYITKCPGKLHTSEGS